MNRTRIIMVVAAAALLALVASFGAYKFLSDKSRAADQARLLTVGIVTAQVDIPLGSTINPNQVALSSWPKETYPKDAIPAVKSVVGRMALRDFVRGEPIVESKLVPTGGAGSGILSLKVPPRMRAFSVKVSEVVGVAGFIIPGSRVDVVVTTTPPVQSVQRAQEQISKIVLENILVLAAGQVIEQKENKPVTVNTVTLSVTPEDSEKLALASNDGKIQLVLRNFADNDNVVTTGSDKARLLASFRPLAKPAPPENPAKVRRVTKKAESVERPARRKFVVEVIKGTKRSEEKFE